MYIEVTKGETKVVRNVGNNYHHLLHKMKCHALFGVKFFYTTEFELLQLRSIERYLPNTKFYDKYNPSEPVPVEGESKESPKPTESTEVQEGEVTKDTSSESSESTEGETSEDTESDEETQDDGVEPEEVVEEEVDETSDEE